MGIFNLLFNKKKSKASPRSGYEFTDEDVELSKLRRAELNELRQEIKRKKQMLELRRIKKQLDELHMDYYDDDEFEDEEEEPTTEDQLMKALLFPILQNLQPPTDGDSTTAPMPTSVVPNTTTAPSVGNITDEDLIAMIKKLPKSHLKAAKRLSDDELKTAISLHHPSLDPNTIDRGVQVFRKHF